MSGYDKLNKDELVGMLEARDQQDRSVGSAKYVLKTVDPAFNGQVQQIFFQHGVAQVPVDLDAEAALLEKIAKAKSLGEPGKKELNQLEMEWAESITHTVQQLESDFGITYQEVNFPGSESQPVEEIKKEEVVE